MTLNNIILNTNLINTKTKVTVKTESNRIIITDNWYTDFVLEYLNNKITDFTWHDNNTIEITVTNETEEIQNETEDE